MSCHGTHKQRLFIGEGGFKGVHALLEKHKESHPNLGKSIVATELDNFGWEGKNHCSLCQFYEAFGEEEPSSNGETDEPSSSRHDERCLRIRSLEERGVTVILGFDGTQIHSSLEPEEKRFHRIHWNCPHDGSSYEKQTLPPIIKDFFSSASQVQEPGDRIHVTLAQPPNKSEFYQGYVYDIRGAAKSSGYRLYAKRRFDSSRYPGYEHEKTKKDRYVSKEPAAAAETLREFVFVKDPFAWPDGRPEHRVRSHPFFGQQREFYVRDTDEESSSYSLSEPETDVPMDCGEDQKRKTPEPDPSPTDSEIQDWAVQYYQDQYEKC